MSDRESESSSVTELLEQVVSGDPSAMERLLPVIYDDLRRLAQSQLANERPGHTLQATAIVHEAYFKLVQNRDANWSGRATFFGVAAETIRRVLVEHARKKYAEKRGGDAKRFDLDTQLLLPSCPVVDVLALDEALEDLARLSERQAKIVVLRVFGGMTNAEAAEALGMKLRTLEGDWSMAKQWLRARIEGNRG